MNGIVLGSLVIAMAIVAPIVCDEALLFWGYDCQQEKCKKVQLSNSNLRSAVSLSACRLYCGGILGTVWPKPTGTVKFEQKALAIESRIKFNLPSNPKVEPLWRENRRRFKFQIDAKVPDPTKLRDDGRTLTVKVIVVQTSTEADQLPSLRYDTDESYSLEISNSGQAVLAEIQAKSFFGARHGLETLSQLIVYDEIRQDLLILAQAEITDAPVYKHRGVLLDTARNYFSIKSIRRTIDAMAMSKLNTFHWHIVDATSFPLVIESQPELYMAGAYSPRKIYTHKDVIDLVEFARARGVRIYPNIDLPAHAGEGWQFKNMTVCFNIQPWKDYCLFPPCGQLDPTNEDVYLILEDIYREIFEIFDLDVFHMGGSQVILKCWMENQQIRNWMRARGWGLDRKDFLRLWRHFQARALAKVDKVSHDRKVSIILWKNDLLKPSDVDERVDSSRYIVQTTAGKGSDFMKEVLQLGHRIILSNYDALFLDCGFASPVEEGNNWCSPYNAWHKIYENRPDEIAGDKHHLILGAETTNWAEQLDEHTVDARFWPRSSALAERLWSNPKEIWRAAEDRMLIHRERLVENGIAAEAIQPEWCLQNQHDCPRL